LRRLALGLALSVAAPAALFIPGCSSSASPDASTTPDMAAPPGLPAWPRGLDPTAKLYPVRRGLRDVRGIIHLHSAFSHDACDGNPLPSGVPAEPCHHELLQGLCATHQDFVFLTDHDTSFSDHDFETDLGAAPGKLPADPVLSATGAHIASWLHCDDGTRMLLQVGSENEVMPIGLESHVSDDIPTRHALMSGSDAQSYAAFRAHGALVSFAHTEAHPLDQLHLAKPDTVELYNIHANIDPKIRVVMNLDPTAPLGRLGPFFRQDDEALIPDLAFLAIYEDLPAEKNPYQQILAEGTRLYATAGTDAHQNTLPMAMSDGERGDSYRRMMRWFSNHLLVDEVTPQKLKAAIKAGRGYVLFEVFGPALGFDAHMESADALMAEMGDEVLLSGKPTLIVTPPHVDLAPGQVAPDLTVRVIRADKPEGTLVATGDGKAALRYVPDRAGAYRVEVRIVPRHLGGYMGQSEKALMREFAWVEGNAFYVK
jgi:hypothetical protein